MALIAGFAILLKGVKVLFGQDSSKWSSHRGKVKGDIVYTENMNVKAKVRGSVTIRPGITVNFKGAIERDLVIEKDAVMNLRGSVGGDVYNKGGTLNLRGTISGRQFQEGPE